MAYLIGVESIPEPGDVVEQIKMSEEGQVVDILFLSGKRVVCHVFRDVPPAITVPGEAQ